MLEQYTMTNKGLRIVTEISMTAAMTQYLKLECHRKGVGKPLGIISQPGRLFAFKYEERPETLALYVKNHI